MTAAWHHGYSASLALVMTAALVSASQGPFSSPLFELVCADSLFERLPWGLWQAHLSLGLWQAFSSCGPHVRRLLGGGMES